MDGEHRAQGFFEDLTEARRSLPLPAVVRDPALDALARKGAEIIDAGVPDSANVLDHLDSQAPLAQGLGYGIAFEGRTPGLSQAQREQGAMSVGEGASTPLLAADPSVEALGWAATGPWAVVVIRSRRLTPADGPPLQAAIEAGLQRERSALHLDPNLAALAKEVAADTLLDYYDAAIFGRAGGVPVRIWYRATVPGLPTMRLDAALREKGGEELSEPWLDRVGVAAIVTEGGTVLFVVLATGETDRGPLVAQLAAATEQQTTEQVNRTRAEASLPAVRLSPYLVEATREWLAAAVARGCFVGIDSGCAGPGVTGADKWWVQRSAWSRQEGDFDWDLTPAEPGDDQLTRFATAATIGPDGLVWMVLALAG